MNKKLVRKSMAAFLALTVLGGGWALSDYSRAQAQQAQEQQTQNQVHWEERDGFRYLTANGIPDHETGRFPSRGNPNRITPQNRTFRMTLTPQVSEKPAIPLVRGSFGVALNGVPFDPQTNGWWNNDQALGWRQVAHAGTRELGLDSNNAHVQPNGAYHYHGLPYGWLDKKVVADKPQIVLTGYAADGFPIYSLYGYEDTKNPDSKIVKLHSSWRLKTGQRPNGPGGDYDGTYDKDYEYVADAGDLDECNGRFGVTPEFPNGTYYYLLTEEFPYVPRLFKGTPDESFLTRPGPPNGGRNGGRPRR